MKLSIGKAWEETSAFLGREARLLAPVALATFALPPILAGWAYPAGTVGSGALWLMLIVLLAALVGQMTVVLLINGWRGSVGEAMAQGLRRLPVLIAALVILFLPIVIVTTIALGGVIVAAGITDPAALTPAALMKVSGLYWIVAFSALLFIILGAKFFVAPATAASESLGPIALIRRSWTLTKGAFWRLVLLFLLLTIAGFVLNAAVTAVVGSIAALAAGDPKPFNTSALLVALASGFVGALVSTVSAAMAGRVYAQLAGPETTVPNT